MNEKSKVYGLVGFIFVLSGFAAKLFYRNYIYSNQIDDLGIADFSPSFFYVTGFSMMLLMATSMYPISTIFIVTLASVLFEIKQYFSVTILDLKDIFASITGGIVSIIIWKSLTTAKKGS